MIQKGSDLVFAPRPAVHKHCNPWRIFKVDSKYLRKEKLFTFEKPTMQVNNIIEIRTKLRKYFLMREKILLRKFKKRKLDWCEEYKLNRIILLNYTERGKIGKLPLIFILLQYLNVLQLLYFSLLCIVYIIFISFFWCMYILIIFCCCCMLIYSIQYYLYYHIQYERTKLHTNTIV